MERNLRVYSHLTIWVVLLTGFFGYAQADPGKEPIIEGRLQLDSIWEPVVYLSHIPTLNDLNTMSSNMIIAQSQVDGQGYFSFESGRLFEDDHLFRLHLSKKGHPAASLIIGGKEQNHLFFIANDQSRIFIANSDAGSIFQPVTVRGYRPNEDLAFIEEIIHHADTVSFTMGTMNREFMDKKVQEQLRAVADTSSHPIVSLYALHHSDFQSSYLAHRSFFESFLDKWKDEESLYFAELRSKLPKGQRPEKRPYLWIAIGFFILGFALRYAWNRYAKRNQKQLKTLSVQERKIFRLIKSGKSNKEISEEYNIGLSTVKSHVSNIYSKLNIKSRKEAMDF